jgi:hypothetical protein
MEPITMPAMAPGAMPEDPEFPPSGTTVTVTVGADCRRRRSGRNGWTVFVGDATAEESCSLKRTKVWPRFEAADRGAILSDRARSLDMPFDSPVDVNALRNDRVQSFLKQPALRCLFFYRDATVQPRTRCARCRHFVVDYPPPYHPRLDCCATRRSSTESSNRGAAMLDFLHRK